MTTISWLQLSDLHQGLHGQPTRWPSIREAFYDDLKRRHDDAGPWDLVLFTGDLTQRGSAEDFGRLTSTLDDLWAHLDRLGSKPLLFAVPGNHDLVRPDAKRPVVKALRQWHEDEEVREGTFQQRSEYHELLREAFAPFEDWMHAWWRAHPPPEGVMIKEGVLPGDRSVLLDKEGLHVGIVGLNSAFLQLEGGEYKGRIGLDPRQVHSVCDGDAPAWVRRTGAALLLTHHPVDWLHPRSREGFLADIAPPGRFVAHLFGHMHEPTSRSQRIAGAAAQREVQAASLFGLETWADGKEQRIHGYSIGCLVAHGSDERLRIAQRTARKHQAGHWEIGPDPRWGVGGDGVSEEHVTLRTPSGLARREDAATAPAARSADAALAAEVARYRRGIAADRDRGHGALGDLGEHAARHGTTDLLRRFVVPTVVEDSGDAELDAVSSIAPALQPVANAEEIPRDEHALRRARRPPEPADRLLFDEARLWSLVMGGPGAGKSALADWVLLKLCVQGEAPAGSAGALCPVRVRMRDVEQRRRKARGEFDLFEHLDAERGALSVESLRALAAQGKVFWIFDGLDEVIDPEARARWAARIGDIKSAHGGRGLVTSRILGSERAAKILAHHGINAHRLLDLDDGQISAWIARWVEALAAPHGREPAVRLGERLLQTLRERPHVLALCRNPLLLTLVAGLSRSGEIPTRRAELYARVLENMADAWEATKALGDGETARFDYGMKVRFLRELAWTMMTELPNGSGNVVGEQDLMSFATRYCERVLDEPAAVAQRTARQLVARLRQRNEVLVYHGENQFGFAHRALLDYLAAEEPLEQLRQGAWTQDRIGALLKTRWQRPEWQECLTLLVGQIADRWPDVALAALKGLLRGEDLTEIVDMRFASFCVRGLAESLSMEREPLRSFALRLTELVSQCSVYGSEQAEGPGSDPRFLVELRVAGARWPGATRLRQWASDTRHRNWRARAVAYQMALATAPRDDRVPLLRMLLEQETEPDVFSHAVFEAQLKGPWTANELDAVRGVAAARGGGAETEVLRLLAASGDDGAIERLLDLLRSGRNAEVRLRAALVLLDFMTWGGRPAPWSEEVVRALPDLVEKCPGLDPVSVEFWLEQAVAGDATVEQRLRGWLHSEVKKLRQLGVRLLARAGDAAAVSLLEERVRAGSSEDWRATFDLQQAAIRGGPARERAASILADRRVADFEWLIELARWWAENIRAKEAGEALRALVVDNALSEELRVLAASVLLALPSGTSDGCAALLVLARTASREEVRGTALQELHQRKKSAASSAVLEATRDFLRTTTSMERRCTAAIWLTRQPDPAVQREGWIIISEIARSDAPAHVRVYAAVQLRRHDEAEAADVLTELAATAEPLRVRRDAARWVQDEATLRQLAESADDADVRAAAQHDLALLEARRRLLQVGERRRGIVSLSGQRVGVIEELPSGGTRFTYDPSWLARPDAKAIAVSLPLRHTPYESEGLLPFFENLLPEGWLLDLARRKLGAAANDAFGLLLATCGDCAGAVEITPAPEAQAA